MVLRDVLTLFGNSRVVEVSIMGSVKLRGTLDNVCYSFGDCVIRKLSVEKTKIFIDAEYPDPQEEQ